MSTRSSRPLHCLHVRFIVVTSSSAVTSFLLSGPSLAVGPRWACCQGLLRSFKLSVAPPLAAGALDGEATYTARSSVTICASGDVIAVGCICTVSLTRWEHVYEELLETIIVRVAVFASNVVLVAWARQVSTGGRVALLTARQRGVSASLATVDRGEAVPWSGFHPTEAGLLLTVQSGSPANDGGSITVCRASLQAG